MVLYKGSLQLQRISPPETDRVEPFHHSLLDIFERFEGPEFDLSFGEQVSSGREGGEGSQGRGGRGEECGRPC
jgi:hypothetical protein